MSLAPFEDWLALAGRPPAEVWRQAERLGAAELRRAALEVLEVGDSEEPPSPVRVEEHWEAGPVRGERVSWDLGYGPRTEAYVLAPVAAAGPLPGVVALHCHGGFKFYGKEKIADGPGGPAPGIGEVRRQLYEGRAYANALAAAGFVVLVPDTFMWGSRRFALTPELGAGAPTPERIAAFNEAAHAHEHVLEKTCRLLGTTLSAIVAREDRAALAYLAARPDVLPDRLGAVGLSGGGLRAVLLQATSGRLAASVVVGMMATYPSLLAEHVGRHTWLLFPPGWGQVADWPDLAACRPEASLLVQYDEDDELFPLAGMRAAHERLTRRYAAEGVPGHYEGRFYPGGHKFDLEMQAAAFEWLQRALAG